MTTDFLNQANEFVPKNSAPVPWKCREIQLAESFPRTFVLFVLASRSLLAWANP